MEIINELKDEEVNFGFSQNRDEEFGCVGHLRCDFGNGTQFWSTWWPHQEDRLNTDEFKKDLDEVINSLRLWPLKDREECKKFCRENLVRCFDDRGYGMKVRTKSFVYIIRLNPRAGDYDAYCYCYRRESFERQNDMVSN